MSTPSVGHRILYFPLTKILFGIILCMGSVGLIQVGLMKLLGPGEIQNLIGGATVAILMILFYTLLYRFYEKRAIDELSFQGLGKNLILGIALGALLQSLTILVIYFNGGFTILSVNSWVYVLPALGMAFTSSIVEEILFRGIIFRITQEKLGSYWALAVSASLFGAAHLANPSSSLIAGIGLAIQAGVLLGAAYIYSNNLWLPIALHFAWNFTQAGIFGAATSGNTIGKSLLTTKIEGNDLISGGAFGPEGSVQATLFCLLAAIALIILSERQHKIVKPFWIKPSVTN
jgi:hypothetical protein